MLPAALNGDGTAALGGDESAGVGGDVCMAAAERGRSSEGMVMEQIAVVTPG